MALLSGLMPGEWEAQQGQAGQPEIGWQDKIGGLLSGDNALFNAGIGILANNNSKNTGRVLARGIQQGSQQTVANRNQKQEAELRKLQMKRYERESQSEGAKEQAHVDFDTKFPEYAGLSRMNPAAAMKIAYPNANANTADPYFTPIATSGGLGSFDNRSGKFVMVQGPNGQPVVKSADDPTLQGQISGAKAGAEADFKINTDLPGQVKTARQVAEMANPSLIPNNVPMLPGNMPQAAAPGAMNIPPALQKQRDDVRLQILLQEQKNDGGVGKNPELDKEIYRMTGGGIRVPTAAQLAGDAEAAKAKAEATAKAQVELPKALASAETALNQIDQLVGSADGKVKPHIGFDSAVGASSKYDPRNYLPGTDATDFNNRLEQLKGGAFLQAFNDLKGGGAITEMEGKAATSAIMRMNTATSEKEFIQAARDYQKSIGGAVDRARGKAGAGSVITAPEKAINLLKLNPKLRDQFDAKYGAGAAAQVLGK